MLPTILRDTTELLNTIQSLDVSPDCFLVTGDVCSLYTNISLEDAICYRQYLQGFQTSRNSPYHRNVATYPNEQLFTLCPT